MKVHPVISLFFVVSLLSCTGKKDENILTWKLDRSDYTEKITVQGTVQAVVNTPVMAPRYTSGTLTVVSIAQDGAYVNKGDTICILSASGLEASYRETQTSIEKLEAELKRTEADNQLKIAMLEAQLATSEAQLKITSLDSLERKYATDLNRRLLELEMKKSIIEKQKTERKLAAARSIGEADIRQQKARIIQEKMRSQTFEDQMKSMILIAQRDGIVMRTEAPRITVVSSAGGSGSFGGPVREGTTLMFFSSPVLQFPDLSRMQISADVSEADFKKIEKGQKVNMTVAAARQLVTTGKVNRKNLAPSQAMRYASQKVKFFEILIDVDSCHTLMKPGLSANCEIILKQEKDTLYVPSLAIFERDSARVVYVRDEDKYRPVKIETGTAGSSFTIITDGLRGDETIALREPPDKLIRESEKNDTITFQKY